MAHHVVILPAQAARIVQETAKTGAAIGVSQLGNVLELNTGREVIKINAGGGTIHPEQEQKLC